MAIYKIKHTELLCSFHYVEAETPEEALSEFESRVWAGAEIDLSDMEMIEENNSVVECLA